MARGLSSAVKAELNSTTFGAPIYCVRLTRGSGDILRWAERPIADLIGQPNALAASPLIYLRVGEPITSPITTVAADSSGHSFNGVYHNAPTLAVDGAFWDDTDTAVRLNGTNQFIQIADAVGNRVGNQFTFDAWVKPDALGNYMAIVDKGRTGANGPRFAIDPTGHLILYENVPSPAHGGVILTSTGTIAAGVWSKVTVTHGGSPPVATMYINGVASGSGSGTTDSLQATSDWLIGERSGGSEFFAGVLDELAIYNTVIDPTTILGQYQSGSFEARLMSLSGLIFSPDQAGPITIVLANVDGAMTTADLDKSFQGAFVEVLAYLPNLEEFYQVWSGWSDEISELSQESATLIAYPTNNVPNVQVPKRTIGLACTNVFGNFANWNNVRDFEGSECPYRRVSTIGFAATILGGMDATTNPVSWTIQWTNAAGNAGAAVKAGDYLKIDSEIFLVTSADPTDLVFFQQTSIIMSRAQKGTVMATHADFATIYFQNCEYSVADCLRRGMYGNNTSDSYTV